MEWKVFEFEPYYATQEVRLLQSDWEIVSVFNSMREVGSHLPPKQFVYVIAKRLSVGG